MSRSSSITTAAQQQEDDKKEKKLEVVKVDASKLTPDEYLERFGVNAYLKDALIMLLENRPENPFEFMAEYFRNALQGTAPMMRALRYIRLTPRNRPCFMDNLVQAYAVFSYEKSCTNLTWQEYIKLLKLLCADIPDEISTKIIAPQLRDGNEQVSFDEFVNGIEACLIFEEFVEESKYLFGLCDAAQRGMIERDAALVISKQLLDSAGMHIGADKISEKLTLKTKSPTITYADFLLFVSEWLFLTT